MHRFIHIFLLSLLCLTTSVSAGDDSATSVEDRAASWKLHENMRTESPFKALRWQAIGPTLQGGRIEAIAADPQRAATLYVGVGSGSLWKTVNNGLTWAPIFEQKSSAAIGDVAVAESDSQTVWVGTGEVLLARSGLPGMGVFKSEDAGKTWTNMGLQDTQHIARLLIHPTDRNVVYVAAIGHQNSPNEQRGIFKTTDGGRTWNRVLFVNDHTAAIDLVFDPRNPQTLYASMWQRARAGQQHSGPESGLYKTTDGGAHWNRLNGGLPAGEHVGRIAVHVAPSNPAVVYALADEGRTDGFYRSVDAGQTWTKTFDGLQARWDWCELRVSPDNENEIYSIGQNSFVSRDGGQSFTKITGTIQHLLPHGARVIHLDTHAMWINPRDTDHVIFGTDGGLFVTHDRCKNWLHLNNMPLAECYAITHDNAEPYNVYVGTQDNAALFGPSSHRPRIGRPDEWEHVYLDRWGGGDSYFTYRDPTDADTIYYEHQLGAMRRKNMVTGKTKDIQPRLSGERLRFAWMTPFFPSRHDGRTVYAAANRVFRSTDRGDNWKPISNNLVGASVVKNIRYRAITTLAESPLKQGILFAGTDNAELHVTTNDGATWTAIDDGLPQRGITRVCASPHNAYRVFVAFSGSGIDDYRPYVFRSDNLGKTWTSISDGLPLEPINVIYEDPQVPNLLYAGTDMGVYASTNGGKTWSSLCANLPTASVYDLFVHPDRRELVIGTHGRSCFLVDARPVQDAARGVTDIGSRRELFVDQSLIAKLSDGAALRLQRPEPREVVLTADRPWEGNTSAYFTVFRDGDRFRMYYRGSHWDEENKRATHPEVTCYAESRDGIRWEKPNLGLFAFNGSKDNNIVWNGVGTHCFTPFRDTNPDCPVEARYKAISRGRPQRKKGLYAFQSPDGIHWSLISESPVITTGAFDSQNLAFWDSNSQCYRCYHRNFRNGIRDIMVQTSDDFTHWSPPKNIQIPNAPREHLYTNAIRQYDRAPHIYLGFPTRYLPKQGQRVEPTFMSSRDGETFARWPDPIIPEDAPQDRRGNRSNYMVHGLLSLPGKEHAGELSVFGTEAYYTGPDNRVRRFAYRTDGFVSLSADQEIGTATTKPITFSGRRFLLNYRSQDDGYVRVEIQSARSSKKAIRSKRLSGNAISEVVFAADELRAFASEPVRLRFELKSADVFSYQFE